MSRVVAEVLDAWRRGERLLEDLPPIDPDHETVRLAVADLRAAYQSLTERSGRATTSLYAAQRAIDRAAAVIRAAEERLERGSTA